MLKFRGILSVHLPAVYVEQFAVAAAEEYEQIVHAACGIDSLKLGLHMQGRTGRHGHTCHGAVAGAVEIELDGSAVLDGTEIYAKARGGGIAEVDIAQAQPVAVMHGCDVMVVAGTAVGFQSIALCHGFCFHA